MRGAEHGVKPRPFLDQFGRSTGRGEHPGRPLSLAAELIEWNREDPPKNSVPSHQTLAQFMFGRIVTLEKDIKLRGDVISQGTAWKVKCSHLAVALPYMFPQSLQDVRSDWQDLRQSLITGDAIPKVM